MYFPTCSSTKTFRLLFYVLNKIKILKRKQVKRNVISIIANLVYELPHELPNDLRKISNLGGEIFPPQKLSFGSSSQKTRKSRYQTFLVMSRFTGFLYSVPNTLPRIVCCTISNYKLSRILFIPIEFIQLLRSM